MRKFVLHFLFQCRFTKKVFLDGRLYNNIVDDNFDVMMEFLISKNETSSISLVVFI